MDLRNTDSFARSIRVLDLEKLRDLERDTIDNLLEHYDSLEMKGLATYEKTIIENTICKQRATLDIVRAEINYQLLTTFVNSCNGLFVELKDALNGLNSGVDEISSDINDIKYQYTGKS